MSVSFEEPDFNKTEISNFQITAYKGDSKEINYDTLTQRGTVMCKE